MPLPMPLPLWSHARLLLVLFAITLCTAFADDWHKEYTLQNKPDLRIETGDANVRVIPWDKKTIDIAVTTVNWKIGPGGLEISESQNGDTVDFTAGQRHTEWSVGWHERRRADVTIHAPREGRFHLRTHDGRLEVAELKGDLELRTGDGKLSATKLDGDVRAQTGDGGMDVSGRFDGLDARSGDGRVEIEVLDGSKMVHEWTLRAGDGSIRLKLPRDFAAMVEAHTGDGHIDLDVPVSVSGRLNGNNIRGALNNGTYLLSLRTGDGSIRVTN
jgi:DUF4097 and DUF4098 domain-containing protein YvlB